MMSRDLVDRVVDNDGFSYRAGDFAENFLASLSSPYFMALRERAAWVDTNFSDLGEGEFKSVIGTFFDQWIDQFQVTQRSLAGEL